MERRWVSMGWGEISYLWGEPAGELRGDVLMLHGGGLDSATLSWGELAPRLVDAGWRVCAPDHPGYGQSDPLPEGVSVRRLVDHAGALADRLGLVRPVVVGLSMGGATALGLSLTRPDLVRALVLLGSYGLGSTTPRTDRFNHWLLRTGVLDAVQQVAYDRPDLIRASLTNLVRDPGALPPEVVAEIQDGARRGVPEPWQQFQASEMTAQGPRTDFRS